MELANIRVLMVDKLPQNGCHQSICPQGELQLPPPSLRGSPGLAGRSDPGLFQITSILGPRACEILCAPFKSGVLFPTAL